MKEKQYDPARSNEKAPAEGMAAVDTHNPEDATAGTEAQDLKAEDDSREKVNNMDNDRQ
jgi:hypothetical protein